EPLLQSPDYGLLGGSRTKGLVDATGSGAEQHVAQLKQSDFRRWQRLDVGDRGGEVGIVQAALEIVQALPIPIGLQVAKDAVLVEVQDPVVQELVVELVEAQLAVVLMQCEVHLLAIDSDAA